jgi:hypothetical protein
MAMMGVTISETGNAAVGNIGTPAELRARLK